MFIAVFIVIANVWKQPKELLTDEQIKNMFRIHTGGYQSAFFKKEILLLMTTCMNLQDINYAKGNKPDEERKILHELI